MLDQWGLVPVLIPNGLADPAAFLRALNIDLLVLTGGDDWGATPKRDRTEEILYRTALSDGIPVLGVCRGLQFIAAQSGAKPFEIEGHIATRHAVRMTPSLGGMYGSRPDVNSFHNLGLDDAALKISFHIAGRDVDGRVEAILHRELPVAAVMWHPEREGGHSGDRMLFEQLLKRGAFWLENNPV